MGQSKSMWANVSRSKVSACRARISQLCWLVNRDRRGWGGGGEMVEEILPWEGAGEVPLQ